MPTLIHEEVTERIVCNKDGIVHKFARFRVGGKSSAAETAGSRLEKRKKDGKTRRDLDTGIRPKRYRERVRRQGQEDLDTNRGAARQKTWREEHPTQERGQKGYSHRA
jgi:hypothetical protein